MCEYEGGRERESIAVTAESSPQGFAKRYKDNGGRVYKSLTTRWWRAKLIYMNIDKGVHVWVSKRQRERGRGTQSKPEGVPVAADRHNNCLILRKKPDVQTQLINLVF